MWQPDLRAVAGGFILKLRLDRKLIFFKTWTVCLFRVVRE